MTPAELFHRAGVALFGEHYVAPLAVALKVDKNTVGKWAVGKTAVPVGVWAELHNLAGNRYAELKPLRFELSDAAEGKLSNG